MDEILELVFDFVTDKIDTVMEFASNKPEAGNYSLQELNSFYQGTTANCDGLFVRDILAKDDDWIEDNHRFIQWLFPLDEASKFNKNAPVLTEKQVTYLKDSFMFQNTLERSFWRMMSFYGFGYPGMLCITDMNKARNRWLKAYDHNHLRISRILNCLDLFEREDLSSILRCELKDAYEKYGTINTETIKYWME